MPSCTDGQISLGRVGRREIEVDVISGMIGSDGGVMPVQQVDRKTRLSATVAAELCNPWDPDRIQRSLRDLIAQRS